MQIISYICGVKFIFATKHCRLYEETISIITPVNLDIGCSRHEL